MASWLLCYSRSAERFSMSKVFGSDLVENDRRNDLAIVGADAARLIWRDEPEARNIVTRSSLPMQGRSSTAGTRKKPWSSRRRGRYKHIGAGFAGHDIVRHSKGQWSASCTNTIQGYSRSSSTG
jgi:hypothetical protein